MEFFESTESTVTKRKRVCLVKTTNNDDIRQNLTCLMGPWYYVVKKVLDKYPLDISYYGIDTSSHRATHNVIDIENADLVIWFTDREYRLHNGTMGPLFVDKNNERLSEINSVVNGKPIIILSNEPADTLELFRDVVFTSKPKLHYILESDFVPSIQDLRYYFFKEYLKCGNRFLDDKERQFDFCYYGSAKNKNNDGSKSTDERQEILRQIRKVLGKKSLYMGSIIPNSDRGYRNDSTELVGDFTNCNSTLCFVWPGRESFTTSRYQEALACGMVPLLWKTFDKNNTTGGDEWLRCYSVNDVIQKVALLKNNKFRKELIDKLTVSFEKTLKPKCHFVNQFEGMIRLDLQTFCGIMSV